MCSEARKEFTIRCNICDAPLSGPKINPEVRGSIDPCDACMSVVEDTLAGYLDKPSAAEDELGQYPLPLDFTSPVDFT